MVNTTETIYTNMFKLIISDNPQSKSITLVRIIAKITHAGIYSSICYISLLCCLVVLVESASFSGDSFLFSQVIMNCFLSA